MFPGPFGREYRDSFFSFYAQQVNLKKKIVQHDKPNIVLQNARYNEVCCVLVETIGKAGEVVEPRR